MHRLERHILGKLARNAKQRYSKLKPVDVESNLFIYHLKNLLEAGWVRKKSDGSYALTAEGKRQIDRRLPDTLEVRPEPRTILLLGVRGPKGSWLLHRRQVQPLIGRVGFVHANVETGGSILDIASQALAHKTGLTASFNIRGSGYLTFTKDGDIESFTTFHLLMADRARGELVEETEEGANFWSDQSSLEDPAVLPSIPLFVELLAGNEKHFFVEKTYSLD